jgi:signal transduction histidine kinase
MNMTVNLLEGANETEQEERIAKIEATLKQNNITLSIFVSGEELYSFGGTVGQSKGKLLDAVGAIGGEGTVTIGNEEVFAENVMANGKTYTVCLFSTTEFGNDTEDNFPAAFPIVMILGTLAVVFLTNRFLTQFVFRKIEEPLDILAAGVHQIRDGNLDYQINYENKDEFASVCEDFNDMAVRLKESVTMIQKQEKNRKELLAGISHDLRSPLTSIKAYSEGLLDGVAKTPESQKAYLQMIKTKTEEIDRMVSKLFLFSKMDMGDYPHSPELIIGFVSGLLGVGISYLLIQPINAIIYNLTEMEGIANLNLVAALLLISGSMVLTLMAGLFPARMAAKKDPVIALRTE